MATDAENPTRIEVFATIEQADEYNAKAGNASSADQVTVGDKTRDRYPLEKREQAKFRADRHFFIQYVRDLLPGVLLNKDNSGNEATRVEDLNDDFRCDAQEVVSIMYGLELETPGYFASSVNLGADQQLKKLAVIELFEVKHGSVEEQVLNNRGRSNEVNQLMNKYTKTELINPTSIVPGSEVCPSGSTGGFLGIGVTY